MDPEHLLGRGPDGGGRRALGVGYSVELNGHRYTLPAELMPFFLLFQSIDVSLADIRDELTKRRST